VQGHLHYGIHRYLPRPAAYITLLRDPVTRVVSLYRYIRNNPRHRLHDQVTSSQMSLETFLLRDTARAELVNGQTRMLSGAGEPDPGPAELDRAKEHLESFEVVGVTESFDASLLLIADRFGWRTPFYFSRNDFANRRRRPGGSAGELAERELRLIRERTELDQELYALARRLLESRLRREGDAFAHRVARFQRWNRYYDRGGAFAWRVRQRLRARAPQG
jgi:hypothetical protein